MLKYFLGALLLLIVAGLALALIRLADEYGAPAMSRAYKEHEAERKFLMDISSDWSISTLEKHLGSENVNAELSRYEDVLKFGKKLDSFVSCGAVALWIGQKISMFP